MKKVFAFMMALALMLSLSVTASAEGTGSITITNAKAGEDYAVYKIFDATISGDKIAYSIKTNNRFFALLFGENGKADNDYFIYTATDTDGGSVVRNTEKGKTDAELLKYLTKLLEDNKSALTPTESAANVTSTQVVFSGLPYGYYFITSSLGGTVTIDSANPDAKVQDKNQTTITLDKKVDSKDNNTVQVGDTVEFSVEFAPQNYNGENKVTEYTLNDTLNPNNWAEIDSRTIKVYVDGTEISKKVTVDGTEIEYWRLTSDPEKKDGFTIYMPWADASGNFLHGDGSHTVKVTYSAVVKEAAANAAAAANENTATLDWSGEDATDKTTTKTYNLGFTKVDENEAPLAGAKFGLYTDKDCTVPVEVSATETEGVYMVNEDGKAQIVTSDAEGIDGQIVIMGLNAGTYYLKELEAPAGYNKLATAKEIVVGEPNAESTNVSNLTVDETVYTANNAVEKVVNNKGVELPSTGGEGTMKMITIGSIVALAFAILLITNKKMTAYQD